MPNKGRLDTVKMDISGAEARNLLKQLASMAQLIVEGQITVDGRPLTAPPPRMEGDRYARTIQESRARIAPPLPADGQRRQDVSIDDLVNAPHGRKVHEHLKPRVTYELAVGKDKKVNTEGLTAVGVGILKYLHTNKQATIAALMTALDLKRSTIANVLTELKRRKLVQSVAIGD